jgi:hypothetical protein
MAISGTKETEADFIDPTTNIKDKFLLSFRDVLLFKLLERIAGALEKNG